MTTNFKNVILNDVSEPANWSPVERAAFEAIINGLVLDCIGGVNDPVNGHRHAKLYNPAGVLIIDAHSAPGVLLIGEPASKLDFALKNNSTAAFRIYNGLIDILTIDTSDALERAHAILRGVLSIENAFGDNSIQLENIGGTGASLLNLGGAVYVVENGNVGIGTSDPSEKLDIIGNAEINGRLVVNGSSYGFVTDAAGNKVQFSRDGASYLEALATNGSLIFNTSIFTVVQIDGVEILRVAADTITSSVGINLSDHEMIDCAGIRFTSAVSAYILRPAGASTSGVYYDVSTNRWEWRQGGATRGFIDFDSGLMQSNRLVVGSPTDGDKGAGASNVETLWLNGVQLLNEVGFTADCFLYEDTTLKDTVTGYFRKVNGRMTITIPQVQDSMSGTQSAVYIEFDTTLPAPMFGSPEPAFSIPVFTAGNLRNGFAVLNTSNNRITLWDETGNNLTGSTGGVYSCELSYRYI